jgi:metal-responsive CopG/Arc/MetJ family transcriptional regulator
MEPYSGMRKIKVDEGARMRRVTARLPANFIEALDQVSALHTDLPSRNDLIRRALCEWLSRKGHLVDEGRSSKRLQRR